MGAEVTIHLSLTGDLETGSSQDAERVIEELDSALDGLCVRMEGGGLIRWFARPAGPIAWAALLLVASGGPEDAPVAGWTPPKSVSVAPATSPSAPPEPAEPAPAPPDSTPPPAAAPPPPVDPFP